MAKFDPSQPFERVKFDPSQPFEKDVDQAASQPAEAPAGGQGPSPAELEQMVAWAKQNRDKPLAQKLLAADDKRQGRTGSAIVDTVTDATLHGGDVGTLGWADELAALFAPGDYKTNRDKFRKTLKQRGDRFADEHPVLSAGTAVASALPAAIAAPGWAGATGLGAVAGLGNSEADTTLGHVGNTALGAGLGAAGQALGEGAGMAAKWGAGKTLQLLGKLGKTPDEIRMALGRLFGQEAKQAGKAATPSSGPPPGVASADEALAEAAAANPRPTNEDAVAAAQERLRQRAAGNGIVPDGAKTGNFGKPSGQPRVRTPEERQAIYDEVAADVARRESAARPPAADATPSDTQVAASWERPDEDVEALARDRPTYDPQQHTPERAADEVEFWRAKMAHDANEAEYQAARERQGWDVDSRVTPAPLKPVPDTPPSAAAEQPPASDLDADLVNRLRVEMGLRPKRGPKRPTVVGADELGVEPPAAAGDVAAKRQRIIDAQLDNPEALAAFGQPDARPSGANPLRFKSKQEAWQKLKEASGIDGVDSSTADAAYERWMRGEGPKPPPFEGGHFDAINQLLDLSGPNRVSGAREAFDKLTKGRRSFDNINTAIRELSEVPGFDKLRLPDDAQEAMVNKGAGDFDFGFNADPKKNQRGFGLLEMMATLGGLGAAKPGIKAAGTIGRAAQKFGAEMASPESLAKSWLADPSLLRPLAQRQDQLGAGARFVLEGLNDAGADGLKARMFVLQTQPWFRAMFAAQQNQEQ